jgi:hypothetical protein
MEVTNFFEVLIGGGGSLSVLICSPGLGLPAYMVRATGKDYNILNQLCMTAVSTDLAKWKKEVLK